MESSIAEKKAVSGLKTIKTDDLDVDQPKETQREHAVPGQIKRDTTANIAGGKQVKNSNLFWITRTQLTIR